MFDRSDMFVSCSNPHVERDASHHACVAECVARTSLTDTSKATP